MSLGESMMNWLRSVDKDQNLQGIDDLTSTSMSGRVRRWFRRQDLTPTLETGYYDTVTEKYVQGAVKPRGTEEPGVVATSAASHAWTAPYDCDVVGVSRVNNTRDWEVSLWITRVGGTIREIAYMPYVTASLVLQSQTFPLLSTTYGAAWSPIRLRTGDILTTVDETFVAADSCLTTVFYTRRA